MKITIEKLTDAEVKSRGINKWPIWEKEVSKFPWHYDSREQCLFLEGEVVVTDDSTGEKTEVKKGDFVTFPVGLSCRWEVKKPVKKHYNFD